jgi:hypothetical protein
LLERVRLSGKENSVFPLIFPQRVSFFAREGNFREATFPEKRQPFVFKAEKERETFWGPGATGKNITQKMNFEILSENRMTL